MTIAGLGEHEKLENIYFCPKCRGVFLFKSDVEDHSRTHAGHEKLEVIPLK
jgi:Zn-finger nucleic acid-binding protein